MVNSSQEHTGAASRAGATGLGRGENTHESKNSECLGEPGSNSFSYCGCPYADWRCHANLRDSDARPARHYHGYLGRAAVREEEAQEKASIMQTIEPLRVCEHGLDNAHDC